VNILLGTIARQIMGPSDVRLAIIGGIVGSFVVVILCGVSIAFGIRSLVSASRNAQPAALGWAGTLVSILALLLWVVAIADLFMILNMMLRISGRGDFDSEPCRG
jgi:hypothetical protein